LFCSVFSYEIRVCGGEWKVRPPKQGDLVRSNRIRTMII
jgi:hypothetical protein